MSRLTWFAANNSVTLADLPDLEVLGITVRPRSTNAVRAFRDLASGHMLVEVGLVRVWRDGRVHIIPRTDCPDVALEGLVRTSLDCVERDLHKRDRWFYTRATKDRPGRWESTICIAPRTGTSLFAEYAEVLGIASWNRHRTSGTSTPAETRPDHQHT